ncbi:hypothetical protein QTP86_008649 [Hemibagrus guttatus]|nr:hypothetical protein QTP86_008649 [Hemibagrus guttatus]
MQKQPLQKYFTVTLGIPLGPLVGIEQKFQELIPGLRNVQKPEDCDFIMTFCPHVATEAAEKMINTLPDQDNPATQILKISHLKYYTLVTGNTLGHDMGIERKLEEQIPGLKKVLNFEESDFILLFCPVVSRAGTDIEAAVKKLSIQAGNKPAVLVVLHHTFDPKLIVPDSSRSVKRQNTITIDCLFHEDQGLLTCFKNDEALSKVINWIEDIPKRTPRKSPNQDNPATQMLKISHLKYYTLVTGNTLGHDMGIERKLEEQIPGLKKVLNLEESDFILVFCPVVSRAGTDIEAAVKKLSIHADQDNPAKQMLKNSHLKYCTLGTGNTLGHDMGIERKLEERIPGLKKVLNLEESDFILLFCPVADIEAAVKKLTTQAGNKPAVLVVLHHTFDPEHIVPDSSRSVKRQNMITVDCLFHEDQGLLTCFKNKEALSKVINWIEDIPKRTPRKSPNSGHVLLTHVFFKTWYTYCKFSQDQDHLARQMLKLPHLKYFTLITGKTLGHHVEIERKLQMAIPHLQNVLNLEESDFILVFCPVVSHAANNIEAAVNMLSTKAGNKRAVLVVLHHTFDPELIVPDSSRSVKRQNTITVDCLFHEDQGLLTCLKNEEALSKVTNWLYPKIEKNPEKNDPFDKLKESQKYNQDVQQVGNQAQGEGEHNECCKDQGLTNQKKENTAQNEDIVQKQLEKNSGQEEKKSGLTENGVKKDNTDPVENECQGEKNDKPEEKNTVDGMTAQSEKEKSQEEEKQGHSKSEEQSFQEPCLQNEKKEEQDEDMKGNQREKGQEQEEYTGEPGGKKSEVTKDHLEDSAVNIEQVQKNENQGENNDEPEEKNIQADEATAACEKEKSQVDKKAREPREQVKEGENDVEPEENVQRGGKGSQDISDHKRAETTEADQQETRTAKKKEKFRFGKKRNHGDNQAEFQLLSLQHKRVQLGSAVTFSCSLSPEISAVNMEIRWFKGTDCVCLYKNRQVTEGRGYKGRVSLFTQELDKGNVSLQLSESRESDIGHYLCQVTDGERVGKLTVRLWWHEAKVLQSYYDRFTAYVEPKANVIFARYKFHEKMQGDRNSDEMIRDRIVFGIHSPRERYAKYVGMEPPKDKGELETVLGMINYLSKFAPGLADVCAPLRQLLKESSPVLAYFDPLKEIRLQVDASKYGLGAVLLQDKRPIAYASKSLSESEINYAQIEKELFAVLFGCKRFHQYICGRQIVSDHKPLESIMRKPLASVPPRLQRMILQLQKYNFSIVY